MEIPVEASAEPLRLNEATSVLWRSKSSVQLELDGRRLVVENLGTDQMRALLPVRAAAPDLDAVTVSPSARKRGDPEPPLDVLAASDPNPELIPLRKALLQRGFLAERTQAREDPAAWPGSNARTPPAAHLAPDLAALHSAAAGNSLQLLKARQQAAVAVHGTSRLAVSCAATLAAAGVGWVQLLGGGDVRAYDACPGGLSPTDEGRRFALAATDAIRRAAPDVDTSPIPFDRSADLVVLTDWEPVDPAVRATLHLDGLAHVCAGVRGRQAVIGPLVVPGVTSCLRCADLHRSERDPAWPALAVQLSGAPRRPASDVALCVATAGVLARQALAYLDRRVPATVDGTLEWHLPDWRLRRRSWLAHPDCDCGGSARNSRTRQNGKVNFR